MYVYIYIYNFVRHVEPATYVHIFTLNFCQQNVKLFSLVRHIVLIPMK